MQNRQGFALATEPIELVKFDSIVPGLPSHSHTLSQRHGRTALITGATGVSEYMFHMVKLLASTERWRKVYCLMRRPLPPTLLADLGANSSKVEWVGLMSQPEPLAMDLRAIAMVENHLDYAFYFSHMQPLPKDQDSSLWYDVDHINNINVFLLSNFIKALRQSGLTIKRFVLQTAFRDYGYGPAANPAFEPDQRGIFDKSRCEEQEFGVAEYCRSAGCRLTVTRPPWTIGAVPDSQIDHPLGLGIFAGVQAPPTRALPVLPGDYHTCDSEQIQSMAMRNAHFEEWLVLSENTTSGAATFTMASSICNRV